MMAMDGKEKTKNNEASKKYGKEGKRVEFTGKRGMGKM